MMEKPRDDVSLIPAADSERSEDIEVPLETSSTSDVQAETTSAAILHGHWGNLSGLVEVRPRATQLARTVMIAIMTGVVSAS
ncbi:hypothetical protein, partial [Brevibacterium casei]